MKKINDLNGWQRAWVILSMTWLLGALLIVAENFPTEKRWMDEHNLIIKMSNERMREEIKEHHQDCFDLLDKDPVAYAECIRNNKITEDNIRSWQMMYTETTYKNVKNRILNDLFKAQSMAAGYSVLIWALPLFIIYIFGVGVAWVIKGFHQESSR